VASLGAKAFTRELALKISVEHLRVYERFKGDEDRFSRCGSAAEKALFADAVWSRISELVQSLLLAWSPWAGEQLRVSMEASAHEACATPEAEGLLRKIVLGFANERA